MAQLSIVGKKQVHALMAQRDRANKIAAEKPQGMAWKAQLEVLACRMAIKEVRSK